MSVDALSLLRYSKLVISEKSLRSIEARLDNAKAEASAEGAA